MKECSYCGRENADAAKSCAECGTTEFVIPAPPRALDGDGSAIDREHLRLLSIFHFVGAGLALLGIVFLFFHFLIMSTVLFQPGIWNSHPGSGPPPKLILPFLFVIYAVAGAILVASASLNLASGFFLRDRKHRMFSLVVAGLNCLHVPFGTLLGVFTIIVLSRDSVRRMYSDRLGSPPAFPPVRPAQ